MLKKIKRIDPIIDRNTTGKRESEYFQIQPLSKDSIMVFRKTKEGVFQTPPLSGNETANSILTLFQMNREGYLVDENGLKYTDNRPLPKGKIYIIKQNDNRKSKFEHRKHSYDPMTSFTGVPGYSTGNPTFHFPPAARIKIDPKQNADLEFRVKMADNARKNDVGAKFPREISKYVNELSSSSDPKMKLIVSSMKQKPVVIGEKKNSPHKQFQ